MRLSYTIRKAVLGFTTECVATADFATVTTLPGGTVLAGGNAISIATPEHQDPRDRGNRPLQGRRGRVTISPSSTQISTYRLTLPIR